MFGRKKKETSKGGSEIYRYEKQENQGWRPPNADNSFMEEVVAYFEAFFPNRETTVFHEIMSDFIHIDVHVMNPTSTEDFYVLYTTGMSDMPMSVPKEIKKGKNLKYAELVMLLPSTWNSGEMYTLSTDMPDKDFWAISLIKFLARFPHEFKTWLGQGHTIPNGDYEPLLEGTEMNGVILLPHNTPQLTTKSGANINFYMVLPISRAEMEYKLEHGIEAFFDKFEKSKVSLIVDIYRKSVL